MDGIGKVGAGGINPALMGGAEDHAALAPEAAEAAQALAVIDPAVARAAWDAHTSDVGSKALQSALAGGEVDAKEVGYDPEFLTIDEFYATMPSEVRDMDGGVDTADAVFRRVCLGGETDVAEKKTLTQEERGTKLFASMTLLADALHATPPDLGKIEKLSDMADSAFLDFASKGDAGKRAVMEKHYGRSFAGGGAFGNDVAPVLVRPSSKGAPKPPPSGPLPSLPSSGGASPASQSASPSQSASQASQSAPSRPAPASPASQSAAPSQSASQASQSAPSRPAAASPASQSASPSQSASQASQSAPSRPAAASPASQSASPSQSASQASQSASPAPGASQASQDAGGPRSAAGPEGYASLDGARAGNYIRRGQKSEEVAALQRALNAAGANPRLEEDGAFGAGTDAALKAFQGSHGCAVDGLVGPETMGALDRALGVPTPAGAPGGQGPGQVPGGDPGFSRYTGREMNGVAAPAAPGSTQGAEARLAALRSAHTQIGVREATGDNDGVPAQRYSNGQNVKWCANFVSWNFRQAGNPLPGNQSALASCDTMANELKRAGMWIGKQDPQPGDVIFFGTPGDYTHVGIVDHVADGKVYTVEGNSGNRVAQQSYPLNSNRIQGYGRPT